SLDDFEEDVFFSPNSEPHGWGKYSINIGSTKVGVGDSIIFRFYVGGASEDTTNYEASGFAIGPIYLYGTSNFTTSVTPLPQGHLEEMIYPNPALVGQRVHIQKGLSVRDLTGKLLPTDGETFIPRRAGVYIVGSQ